MMPSAHQGVPNPPAAHPVYNTDAFLSELSQQIAASQCSRRSSRGANGHQRSGCSMTNAMRISKPASVNNSPSSSNMAARRRTFMYDGTAAARRRNMAMDQTTWAVYTPESQVSRSRTARPLSWHPSSHNLQMTAVHQQQQFQQQAQQQQAWMMQYPLLTPCLGNEQDFYTTLHQPTYSPAPVAYSCSASPNSAFSPLSLPFNDFEPTTNLPVEGWNLADQPAPAYVSSGHTVHGLAEPFPTLPGSEADVQLPNGDPWHDLSTQTFHTTSPPTPDNLPHNQLPQPVVTSEETIPYQPLNESEEEGEILIGMGLYDAPDKYDNDPHLNHSRSAMSLLGSSCHGARGPGKGLKLEEAWHPPESEDEEDSGEDGAESQTDAVADEPILSESSGQHQ